MDERVATSCVISFVALDRADGKPTPVPPWQPLDDEDRRLAEYARRLIELSKTMEAEVARFRPVRPSLAPPAGG